MPGTHIVSYANMPVKTEFQHSLLSQLPSALRARMKADGLSQLQLSMKLSIGQPQISRALAGRRKRLTEPMKQLCRYAGLYADERSAEGRRSKLNVLVGELVGDSELAATLVEGVMLSLAPILKELRVKHE